MITSSKEKDKQEQKKKKEKKDNLRKSTFIPYQFFHNIFATLSTMFKKKSFAKQKKEK